MLTEAFNIKYNDKIAYLNIDRTYKYGGIMLLSNLLNEVCFGGIDGYTYFEQFSLEKWLNQLNVSDGIITIEVSKNCDGMINNSIHLNDKENDVLSIKIEKGVVIEVKNSNNEVVYNLGDDDIEDWPVGWFGKVFDYYTNIITKSIEEYEEYDDMIWGVFYR